MVWKDLGLVPLSTPPVQCEQGTDCVFPCPGWSRWGLQSGTEGSIEQALLRATALASQYRLVEAGIFGVI